MNLVLFLLLVVLFAVLTPGVLLRLPKNGSKWTVAFTHGLVFALVWTLSHRTLVALSSPFRMDIGGSMMEGMTPQAPVPPQGSALAAAGGQVPPRRPAGAAPASA
jgi:hypothetical protein